MVCRRSSGRSRSSGRYAAAGAQHGEERDHHVDAARQRQRNDPLGPGAAGDQPAGHGVDPGVQLGVGQALVAEDQRDGRRGARGLRRQHLGDGLVRDLGGPAVHPVIRTERQRAGGHVQAVGERAQDRDERVHHRPGLGRGDHVGPVLQLDPQVRARRQHPGQRVVRGVGVLHVDDALRGLEVVERAVGEEVL
nr:hypothetical protein GCM10020092_091470 [Actinoplanes digitatis]